MMNALSVPMTQGPAPTGFAAFLATTGPGETDGDGGFEQLLADAPVLLDGAVTQPDKDGVTAETPATVTAPAEEGAEDAAASAASLLIALTGTAPAGEAARPAPPPTNDQPEAQALLPIATAAAAAPVIAAEKPVKSATHAASALPPHSTAASARNDSAPTTAAGIAARTAPVTVAPPAEPAAAAARPATADAAPSMAVIFTQSTTQGTPGIAEAARPAVVAERLLDMSSDDVWIEQLARDIRAAKSPEGDISFRLMPRHLGRLDVAMQLGDEGVSLKLETRHETTATIVQAAQGRLVDELRQQGVRVAGAEVTCTPGETGRQSGQDQGRAATANAAHLIETANDRAVPRDEEASTADRRGRFA